MLHVHYTLNSLYIISTKFYVSRQKNALIFICVSKNPFLSWEIIIFKDT